jgi:hypothetical protein
MLQTGAAIFFIVAILHYGRDDGRGDENDPQASGWRFVAFLAKFGYLFGGYGEAGVDDG